MIVKGHDIDLPSKLVLGTVVDSNWQITSVVEAAELTRWHGSSVGCSSLWLRILCLLLWSEKGRCVASNTSSLFESVSQKFKCQQGQIKFKSESFALSVSHKRFITYLQLEQQRQPKSLWCLVVVQLYRSSLACEWLGSRRKRSPGVQVGASYQRL